MHSSSAVTVIGVERFGLSSLHVVIPYQFDHHFICHGVSTLRMLA